MFGEIAAAHALSDLHAMGAQPWTALAVAAVPYAPARKMRAGLADMLQGATGALAADGCSLVGGHSAEAAEPALGFAVTGLADPSTLLRKAGLQPGDALVLTKPLGTGIVLAGHMRGLAHAAWLQAAIASMRSSNAVASHLFACGATACTDITGFGLAGHLMEMLQASSVGAVLWTDAVPALPGALELAAQGVESTLAPQNRRALSGGSDRDDNRRIVRSANLGWAPRGRSDQQCRSLHGGDAPASRAGDGRRYGGGRRHSATPRRDKVSQARYGLSGPLQLVGSR